MKPYMKRIKPKEVKPYKPVESVHVIAMILYGMSFGGLAVIVGYLSYMKGWL